MFRFVSTRRPQRNSERGFFLIAAIFAVTLMIIALAASIPAIRGQIKRDREDELIHRGRQYERAIQLYYRKFGRYPNSIDDLVDTNNIRFLRSKYVDPITGKDEWRIIHNGEQQPVPLPPYISRPGGGGGGGVPASGISSGVGAGGATNASSISSRLSSNTTNTPGVGPIVGVASTSDQTSLKEINGKTKYSDWEFVYDPSLDATRGGAGANNSNGQGLGNGTNNNGGRGNPGNFGNPAGGSNPNPTPRPPGGR